MSRTNTIASQTLREGRKRKGWSQFWLAVQAGLHPNTVSIAERTGYLSQRSAERLAVVLGVPVESLRGAGEAV